VPFHASPVRLQDRGSRPIRRTSTRLAGLKTKKSAARIASRRHRFLASTVFALCLFNLMRKTRFPAVSHNKFRRSSRHDAI
jgi:hypothetical protein